MSPGRFSVLMLCCAMWGQPASGQVRVFMAADGEEGLVATTGNTTLSVVQGGSATVMLWIEDTVQNQQFNGHQFILPYVATPQGGAVGSVEYIDLNPGGGGGDSVFIDIDRSDFVLDGGTIANPVYNETPGSGFFGAISSLDAVNDGVTVSGIRYLGEFDISTTLGTSGQFEIALIQPPTVPNTTIAASGGVEFVVNEFQALTIDVQLCSNAAQCDDGITCTIDACMPGGCASTPVDCSVFDTECTVRVCDPGGSPNNCAITENANEGESCDGDSGSCHLGACQKARVFMAPEGQELEAPASGDVEILVTSGSTTRITAWAQDIVQSQHLAAYRLSLPWQATPLPGASGTLTYVDNAPGMGGGDSVLINESRGDYVFATETTLEPIYDEAAPPGANASFLMFGLVEGLAGGPTISGVSYLGEFDFQASADAAGFFELAFRVVPTDPPTLLTALISDGGGSFGVHEFQKLIIEVSTTCATAGDCADLDNDDIRDDGCVWWDCDAGECLGTDVVFADMGGQFGACPPDGAADNNDRNAALNCFADVNAAQMPGYPCEQAPPIAFNVDTGGQFGSCMPDGVCDGNDAFAALNAFSGSTTCSCPLDGGPQPVGGYLPVPVADAKLALVASARRVKPGMLIEVDVHLAAPLEDLRGYQLHLGVSGGASGALDLVDISAAVHDRSAGRGDRQRGVSPPHAVNWDWAAFNVSSRQMLVGLDGPGVAVGSGHLATFTFEASVDARGTFVIELLHDVDDAAQRTYLFPTLPNGRIELAAASALRVHVE